MQRFAATSTMATRMQAARFIISRRLSSSGKVLSEEEKAAENVYIKKMEQEKLDKLARKGYKPEDQPASTTGTTSTGDVPNGPASTSGTSTDKDRNYAVLAGVVAAGAALGWYLKSNAKKPEEVQD